MPSIEQNLAAILAAKYGKDVRQAIHDSIGQNYEDVVNGRIYMDGATDDANAAAALANTKAGLADTAAISANDAATLANTKAGLADTAAMSANSAADLANTKAGLADTAAMSANSAAALANTKAGLADAAATLAEGATQEALDNIIISASFSGNNINFTKANTEVITLLNAKSELRGETGLNMNGSSGALLFVGDEASAKAQSIEVTFSASLGGLMYGVTIVSVSGLPAGMTYAISLNGSTGPKVTFTSTTSMVSPYGLITVTCVSVPNVGSRSIKIPYAIAFKGHSISSAEVSGDDLIFHLTDETIITVANAMKDVNDAAVEVRETYYLGPDQPISNNAKIWLDTDEPDLMANYQDMMDATQAANDNIIESVGFDEDDMVFTKADTTTHVISGAYSALSGNSIVSVTRTDGDGTPGTTDEYTITYSKEAPTSFTVYNGADAPSLAGVHQYIVRWDKVNAECTRMGDAADITTTTTNFGHFGSVNPTYNNPFDELYPWKYRKLCKVDRAAYALLDPGSPITDAVTAWEGEPGFTLDGTGDFDGVYTPEFWARDWEDATYRYIGVADGPIPGWQYFEATIGGRYFGSMDGSSKITSIADAIPLRNTLMSTMHTNVTSQGMTLDDIFTWCADTVLMAVEYACLNSQQVLGNGCDALYRQSAETIGENASASATLLKLPNAFAAYCVAGAIIGIGTTDGKEDVAITRFISSADLDGVDPLFETHKGVTITPLTNPVTTAHFVSVHGTYNAPDVAIGSKSGYLGSNTKVNAYYRGRVAHANYWRYVLGAYRQTGDGSIWVANSRIEAAAYDALNTDVHRDTGKDLPTINKYIATLHADNLLPLAPFAATTGGTSGSGDPVGDACYVPTLATGNTILRLGGTAVYSESDGRFYGDWSAAAGVSAWYIAVLPYLKTP